jgi:hypothetical protein
LKIDERAGSLKTNIAMKQHYQKSQNQSLLTLNDAHLQQKKMQAT